ncbi:protein Smaug-like [Ctenocephalides felis]|uniref:protein Smaug-like n=1 Tax=Ctenocephalides felis TaxID=7515 RepID=UPI000E6E1F44|nr:protein Smaug-like [Ctenocephalides felis]
MKYSTSMSTMKNSNALFCEQVETITNLFQNWNECEQTVVLYALLRGIPYQNLKFLQMCIENNLQNVTYGEFKTLEQNANNANYLRNLLNGSAGSDMGNQMIDSESLGIKNSSYRNMQKQMGSDRHMNFLIDNAMYSNDKMQDYCKNGFQDVTLDYFKGVILPEFLHCLPLLQLGNDEAKNVYLSLVPQAVIRPGCEDLCQQLLSYLLIHPAVTGEDRRCLTQYLHHLQEHIALGGATQPDITSSIKNGDGSAWSLHNSQKSLNTDKPTTNITTSYPSWSNFNPDYEQLTKEDFGKTIGKNVAYTKTDSSNNFDDDSQLSFSKNGTEIEDSTTENIQDSSGNNDFFTQNCKLYNIAPKATESPVKTHRSSSLTPSSDDGILFHSNENLSLLTLMQKPRSYSLSSEHNALLSPHNSLISSGSESRLDDFKNSSAKTTASKNAGMTNIAQWLKSLRLHKYIWLFSNTSYEDMMAITEEYLARLGVTKGARHKLYLSIQRLKERYSTLCNVERDLISSHGSTMFAALEEMRSVIVSPIKPHTDDDIVRQFIKVLDIVSSFLNNNLMNAVHDEECLALYFWVLDRAIGNEAFVAHVGLLKNMKYNTIKMNQYQNKLQYKNVYNTHSFNGRESHRRNSDFTNNGRNSKTRWNQYSRPNRPVPPPAHPQWNLVSNHIGNFQNPYHMTNLYNKPNGAKLYQHIDNNDKHAKSSSYPNFNIKPESAQNFEPHRHSLTSLVTPLNNVTNKPQQTISKVKNLDENVLKSKSSVVEINNRLESLCLQMTEQAIE